MTHGTLREVVLPPDLPSRKDGPGSRRGHKSGEGVMPLGKGNRET